MTAVWSDCLADFDGCGAISSHRKQMTTHNGRQHAAGCVFSVLSLCPSTSSSTPSSPCRFFILCGHKTTTRQRYELRCKCSKQNRQCNTHVIVPTGIYCTWYKRGTTYILQTAVRSSKTQMGWKRSSRHPRNTSYHSPHRVRKVRV